MDDPIMVRRFKELGLTPYETKSYVSLLEKNTLTVTEVARMAGIPRANAYEALEKLLTKGFCVSKPGKIKKYSATDPAILERKATEILDRSFEDKLDKLDRQKEEILAEKKEARQNLANLIRELTPIYKNGRSNGSPLDYIEIIKDPHQMHAKFLELIEKAEHEILGFDKPPYSVPRDMLVEQGVLQAGPLSRGITIKAIYEIPAEKEEIQRKFEEIEKQVERGEDARVIRQIAMKMAIFDERIVLLAMKDPISAGTSFTTQVVEHPDLAKSLKILFYHFWEQAEDHHVLEDLLKEESVKTE